jgi:putative transposase
MAPADGGTRRHRTNFNDPGHAHELAFSCYHRVPFLSRERTCEWLVAQINQARRVLEFDVWAWVLMPDHVHLIVHPRQSVCDIASIRRLIKEPVARNAIGSLTENAPEWLPSIERRRRSRREYLFWQSGGGYDRNITDGNTLLRMINDIHENPVRQGLVTRGADWKCFSATWYVDGAKPSLVTDSIPPEWLADTTLGP